jgi:hypothetical protein
MATPRLGWGAGTISLEDGRILVAGGVDTNAGHVLAAAELYDPVSGLFSAAGQMSNPRARFAVTMLANGKILAVGGVDDSGTPVASADIYDPGTNAWSATGGISVAKADIAAVTLADGRVLVPGGSHSVSGYNKSSGVLTDSTWENTADIYNPASGTFVPTGNLTVAHSLGAGNGAAVLPTGDVFVVGGIGVATADLYHTAAFDGGVAGTFSSIGTIPQGIQGVDLAVNIAGGKVFTMNLLDLAGSNSTTAGNAALYDPSSNSFGAAPSSPIGATSAAVLLRNGDVFCVGGESSGAPTNQTTTYKAASSAWRMSANTTVIRHAPALANLPNGSVLVVGGCTTNTCGASVLASAEICNP